jgi:hypothetical protein
MTDEMNQPCVAQNETLDDTLSRKSSNTMKILNQTLAIALFTLLLVRCSKEKDIPVNSLKDVMTNLAPRPKTFEISPAEETMLEGDKGTAVYIPADAFQFADGTAPTGKVNIELKECYSLPAMIGENLHTTSQGRILQTAGMIYFNATADGKQLSLKDDKAFVIGFPKNDQADEMDLFYDFAYSDTASTWVPDYKMFEMDAIETVTTTKLQRANGDINMAQTDSAASEGDESADYPIEMTPDLYDYGFTVYLWTSPFDEMFLPGKTSILDFIQDPANSDSASAREFSQNDWRVPFEFKIDKNGAMNNFRVMENNYLYSNYDARAVKIALDLLKSVPAFDLDSVDNKVDHDWGYQLGISGTRRINWERFKTKFRAQFSTYKDKAIQQLDKTALDYYMFSATKMGWINCDRFWDTDEEKIDFIVTAPKDAQIQLVFKDIKSIMTGTYKDGQLVFRGVPLGRQIKIIGISYANGKPAMGVAETTIDKDGFELMGFKEFSLDELETELNK